ncbi:MAG: ATP-dependent RecD-like DNA helicase [Myxococcales bacterium]|nr:ATP-dependent RecD-like DNA helicase [Myxococcales bacterium]
MAYADRIDGELVRFTFRAPERGFAVARLKIAEATEVTVVGAIAGLHEGQRISAEGQWGQDPKFGRQFRIESFLIEDPRTMRGMEKYLASALPGVGEELARRIVEHFGLDTLTILADSPDRLVEVAGIRGKTLERIKEQCVEGKAEQQLMVLLRGFELPAGAAHRVIERFGKDAHSVVQRTPYRLTEVRGIGFRTADQIAMANGMNRDSPERVGAAILHVLEACEDEGSCYLPEAVVVERVCGFDIDVGPVRAGVDQLAELGRIVRKDVIGSTSYPERERPIYRVAMDRIEANVARLLRARVSAAPALAVDIVAAQTAAGIELSAQQAEAVRTALTSGLTVITGGPGTGKTTIVKVLLAAAHQRGLKVGLASPTGRAARRLAETCATAAGPAEAKTLHRMLEFNPLDGGFVRGVEKPVEADLVLVDEASMVDLRLAEALLLALGPRARLVLVGDVDQLPSVGAGRVLADVIRSAGALGQVPVARLTAIYRQAQASSIVRNAWRVNRGELPISSEHEEGMARDFFVLRQEDAEEARGLLLRVVLERLPKLGFEPTRDVQVLTPMHAGPLGTVMLNKVLQDALNPRTGLLGGGAGGHELTIGKRVFRAGDRVLQTKNDYDLDVFNGDVGRVLDVTPSGLTADFDGRLVQLGLLPLESVEHAYAISIHKSQGSEYPAVIAIVHHSHFVMLRRNLLYTALTRARRFVCLITSGRGLTTAVSRPGEDNRWTGLKERLC